MSHFNGPVSIELIFPSTLNGVKVTTNTLRQIVLTILYSTIFYTVIAKLTDEILLQLYNNIVLVIHDFLNQGVKNHDFQIVFPFS